MPRKKTDITTFPPPDWFRLSNYNRAEKLNLEGWLIQLGERQPLWFPINENDMGGKLPKHHFETFCVGPEARRNRLLRIQQKPFFPSGVWSIDGTSQTWPSGIRPVMDRDIHHFEGENKEWEKNFDGLREEFKPIPVYTPPGHAALWVNLTLPDKILKEQFKIILAKMRTDKPWTLLGGWKHKLNRTGGCCDLEKQPEKWYEYEVLPYIDLRIWAKNIEKTLPDGWFAAVLGKTETEIRDYTRPLAEELLSDNFMGDLATYLTRP